MCIELHYTCMVSRSTFVLPRREKSCEWPNAHAVKRIDKTAKKAAQKQGSQGLTSRQVTLSLPLSGRPRPTRHRGNGVSHLPAYTACVSAFGTHSMGTLAFFRPPIALTMERRMGAEVKLKQSGAPTPCLQSRISSDAPGSPSFSRCHRLHHRRFAGEYAPHCLCARRGTTLRS